MADGNGMPTWEEWDKQLTEEQRRYSLYKVLADLYHRDCRREELCDGRLKHCLGLFQTHETDIKSLKDRKKLDTTVSGGFGLIGGALAIIGKKIIGLLTGG